MKAYNVKKYFSQDGRILILAVFVSVVSFLVVSAVTVFNVLITRELNRDLENLRIQVETHQNDIKVLKNLLDLKNEGRQKRSIICDSIEPHTDNEKIDFINNSKKLNKNLSYNSEETTEITQVESTTGHMLSHLKAEQQMNKTSFSGNIKKHVLHKHRKHHRHHIKKQHLKGHGLEQKQNITFSNENFNTPFTPPTEESVVTETPPVTPRCLNESEASSDLKYITKRSYDSYDRYNANNSPEFSPYTDEGVVMESQSRETRSRNTYVPSKNSRRKPLPSIHFSGDTSRYQLGVHENFKGNGHLRHPNTRFVDWVPSNWVHQTGMLQNHFSYSDGYLTIKEKGLYFVYAQVHYYDEHDENAFRIYRNGQWFLQCTAAAHSATRTLKGSSCYTAAVEYLYENEKIHLADIGRDRYSVFETGKSFFGVIKL